MRSGDVLFGSTQTAEKQEAAADAGITSSPLPCELSVLRLMGQTILLTPCMHRIAHAGWATGTPRRLSGQA